LLYLIKKLHQITARAVGGKSGDSYILLRNYIKSQLMVMMVLSVTSYILLRNYIKSQHALASLFEEMGYILLRNYIKSQP